MALELLVVKLEAVTHAVSKAGDYANQKLMNAAGSPAYSAAGGLMDSWVKYLVWGGVGLAGIITLTNTVYTVEQQQEAVIQRFGKFNRTSGPGLHVKIPFVENVVGRVSLRVQQLGLDAKEANDGTKGITNDGTKGITIDTITKDKVSVELEVPVQYQVVDVQKAFYSLTNPKAQITAYVNSIVRAEVPKLTLDEVFEKKEEIGKAITTDLSTRMGEYGFKIIDAPVTNINPNAKVRDAMNEINAAERLRVAAEQQGEASKILAVKKAEGEKSSMELYGEGVANQRKTIIEGFAKAMSDIKLTMPDLSDEQQRQIAALLVTTNYIEALERMVRDSKAPVIMVPYSPTGGMDLVAAFRNSLVAANLVDKATGTGKAGSEA